MEHQSAKNTSKPLLGQKRLYQGLFGQPQNRFLKYCGFVKILTLILTYLLEFLQKHVTSANICSYIVI